MTFDIPKDKLPNHVAIIMDGNGRWAKKRILNRVKGHTEGVKRVKEIMEFCKKINIPYLTLYAFSTENWKRPQYEVQALMNLFVEQMQKQRNLLLENHIRLKFIGDLDSMPKKIKTQALELSQETEKNGFDTTMIVALNYGARAEILNAVKIITKQVIENKLSLEKIDEKLFSSQLYTKDIPDPDLIIRTSGEQRLSNFLMWQASYSEFYFTETLWPDFKEECFVKALKEYAKRQRRFGKTSEQLRSKNDD
jgi:undecaprenyl diphosphate synthase